MISVLRGVLMAMWEHFVPMARPYPHHFVPVKLNLTVLYGLGSKWVYFMFVIICEKDDITGVSATVEPEDKSISDLLFIYGHAGQRFWRTAGAHR